MPIGEYTELRKNPLAIADGEGGVIVGFDVVQSGTPYHDVGAQKLDRYGNHWWGIYGTGLTSTWNVNEEIGNFGAIVNNGNHGCVAVWVDERSGGISLYAMRAEGRTGDLGRPEPVIGSVVDVPLDQGGEVTVNWLASEYDLPQWNWVTYYSVWRSMAEIPGLPAPSAADNSCLISPSDVSADFSGPGYWIEHTPTGDYYWAWVGNQNAYNLYGYAYSAPTFYDSTGADPAVHHFQVIAHGDNSSELWISAPHAGYSVDNIAPPGAPQNLTAWREITELRLEWTQPTVSAPDFSHYAVYRDESPGVTPGVAYLITTTGDTTCVDTGAVYAETYYYVVTAVDIHGNQSSVSNEVEVENTVISVDDVPAPSIFTVYPNVPNPFNGETQLRFELPERTDVSFEVFDVKGRRVWSWNVEDLPPGLQSIPFAGRDGAGRLLPSGVYFYRISVPGYNQVRKMVITR
jgi:hypothetical protein